MSHIQDLVEAQKNARNLVMHAPADALRDFFTGCKYHEIIEFFDAIDVELDRAAILRLMQIFTPQLSDMIICVARAIDWHNLAIQYNFWRLANTQVAEGDNTDVIETITSTIADLHRQRNELKSFLDNLIRTEFTDRTGETETLY
jgi:hypothetical protein